MLPAQAQEVPTVGLSLVIPLYDEAESLPELLAWIARVVGPMGVVYEVLLIDDGSKDNSWAVIEELRTQYPMIRAARFGRNYGKSAALNTGFQLAVGKVVITLDADLQDSPDEIPGLYKRITTDGFDLVSGWKKKRFDPLIKTIPSKFFNWATRRVTGIPLHDFNCGLKAYRGKVVKSIEVYGEMHRYIPYLAKEAGFNHIGEQVVQHQARKYGKTKFGWERFVRGFLDLLSLSFVLRFRRRPMHFFGLWGTVSFLVGFGIALWLIGQKLYYNHVLGGQPPRSVTEQPVFYLALIAIVVGVQLFLAGFVGELVGRAAPDRNSYLIDETLN
jgi:glycosyltransferase involved in cell wall biosynthesis